MLHTIEEVDAVFQAAARGRGLPPSEENFHAALEEIGIAPAAWDAWVLRDAHDTLRMAGLPALPVVVGMLCAHSSAALFAGYHFAKEVDPG